MTLKSEDISFHLLRFLRPCVFSLLPSLASWRGGAKTRGKEARKGNEDAQIRNEKHPWSKTDLRPRQFYTPVVPYVSSRGRPHSKWDIRTESHKIKSRSKMKKKYVKYSLQLLLFSNCATSIINKRLAKGRNQLISISRVIFIICMQRQYWWSGWWFVWLNLT